MVWKPHPEALGLSLSIDLRQIRQQDAAQPTHLISGRIYQNRAARSAAPSTVDLAQRSSVSDAFQQSEGLLANPGREENRIDVTWPRSLATIVGQGVITADQDRNCAPRMTRSSHHTVLPSMHSCEARASALGRSCCRPNSMATCSVAS